MDDKALALKLDKFTEELKNIAKILKVANGFKISSKDPEFKGGSIKGDERKRAENVAKITAKELAAALGTQFKTVSNSIVIGLKGHFDDLGVKLTNIKNGLDNSSLISGLGSYFDDLGIKLTDIKDGLLENSLLIADLGIKLTDIKDGLLENSLLIADLGSYFDNLGDKLIDIKNKLGSTSTPKGLSNKGIALAIHKTLGWDAFKDNLETWSNSVIKRLSTIQSYMAKLVGIAETSADPTKSKKKKEEGKGIGSILGGIAGLALLGVGIFMIVQALVDAGKINTVDTIKVLLVVGGFATLFLLLGLAGGKIKNAAIGFAIMAGTILFLILPTLNKLAKMDFKLILNGLGKFSLILGACIGLMWLMSKIKKSDVIINILGLGLLTLTIGFVMLPQLMKLANANFDLILDGLKKFGLIIGSCIGLLFLMSKIKKSNVLVSTLALGAMIFLIGYLADNLMKYAYKPWNAITEGLEIAGIAFGVFFGLFTIIALGIKGIGKFGMAIAGAIMFELVFLVGYLADNLGKFADKDWDGITEGLKIAGIAFGGLFALFGLLVLGAEMLGGGIVGAIGLLLLAGVMVALAYSVGLLADGLKKYSEVDPVKLEEVGKSMLLLAAGMAAMTVGTFAGVAGGVVGALGGLFKLDPVSQLKKFETLDSNKLLNLGTGIKYLAEGLKSLSDTKNINLDNITKQMVAMISPLGQFSIALGGFKTAYEGLDKAIKGSEINRIYQMKIEADNGIQKALVDLNQKEVEILSAQLDQLRQNGEYLRTIANSGGGMGGMVSLGGSENSKSKGSAEISNFQTKNNYLNHLKLVTSALAT